MKDSRGYSRIRFGCLVSGGVFVVYRQRENAILLSLVEQDALT